MVQHRTSLKHASHCSYRFGSHICGCWQHGTGGVYALLTFSLVSAAFVFYPPKMHTAIGNPLNCGTLSCVGIELQPSETLALYLTTYARIQRSISCAGLGDAGTALVARCTFPQQAGAPHSVCLSSAHPSSHMQPQLIPHCTATVVRVSGRKLLSECG